MDGNGSGSYPASEFGIHKAQTSVSVARKFIYVYSEISLDNDE
jgi:hypothetical protein